MSGIVVAVSQRVDIVSARGEVRDGLDQRLVQWICALNGVPFPIPNVLAPDTLMHWLSTLRPTAVILSGGNDIGENAARDDIERQLLDYAAREHLPLLACCRGMQMMAVWLGSSLRRVSGHVATRHRLQGEFEEEVNSFHEWGLAECPRDCVVLARAEDGAIEAIRHNMLPWEGWMWHPEREAEFAVTHLERARLLLRGYVGVGVVGRKATKKGG